MKAPHSPHNETPKSSAVRRVFRFGVLFSAAMVVISSISNISTQLVNKLGLGQTQASASNTENAGLLPYETPAFKPFSNMFINEAHAVSPPGVMPSC